MYLVHPGHASLYYNPTNVCHYISLFVYALPLLFPVPHHHRILLLITSTSLYRNLFGTGTLGAHTMLCNGGEESVDECHPTFVVGNDCTDLGSIGLTCSECPLNTVQ